MIQFFIENQEVILPDDFSFTQIDENPLITNNGEFTLDITVSLRNGKNAKAAKFINRINKIDIDTSYNALMIDDGKYKHGTIIIQSHTNTDMTFQFVAGNSELNYLAKNDKKIWELDWGTESAIDYARALASLNQTGWFETDSGNENLLVGSAVIAFGSGAELRTDQTEKYYRSTLHNNTLILFGLNYGLMDLAILKYTTLLIRLILLKHLQCQVGHGCESILILFLQLVLDLLLWKWLTV